MKALLVVDMQNDFMPGGALPVPEGDKIISIINHLINQFSIVVATQDWHPADHVSFAPNHPGKKVKDVIEVEGYEQLLWPVHCVRHTKGAELVTGLKKESISALFHKGTDKFIDSYSTFFDNARRKETGLHPYLISKQVDEIYIAGVATDYCVLYSALDAVDLGFRVNIIIDACRGINVHPHDVERSIEMMAAKGAKILMAQEVFSLIHPVQG